MVPGGIYDLFKLKDLKFSGTIGGLGEKDKLSYSSLSYQIANARDVGYSEQVICAVVIKAISPGNNLRTYLQSKRDLNLKTLMMFYVHIIKRRIVLQCSRS